MKTILSVLLGLLCLSTWTINAQEDNDPYRKNFLIGQEMILLFNAGLNLDVEMRLKESDNWLFLRLTGYPFIKNIEDDYVVYHEWKSFYSGYDNFRELSGLGFEAAYKRTFFRDRVYCGTGIGYHYFDVSYRYKGYEPFTEDGMTFYHYQEGYKSQYFNKLNAFLTFGARTSLRKRFFVEGFLSPGYAYSFYDKNKKAFDSTMYSFGHRGFTLGFGFRLGWAF